MGINKQNGCVSESFWQKNPIEKVINEVIDPTDINVKRYIPKKELNKEIWDENDQLKPILRKQLLKVATEFIKFLKIKDIKIKDIIITGSLANYNWNDLSDFDIHVLLDFNDISEDREFVSDFFKSKKDLWNDKIPIKIKNHDVELYVQDVNEPHASTGIYSLLNNKWITKPLQKMLGLDVSNLQHKASKMINDIDNLLNKEGDDKLDIVKKIIEKLKNYRQTGLNKDGELSYENLVYKILRNYGYIDKLQKLKNSLLAKNLSLENYDHMKKYKITEEQQQYLINKKRNDAIVESIIKEITDVRNSLNEDALITEAVSDVLKKYYKKGLLTTAVLSTLLSNNVIKANDLVQAGIDNNVENVDQNQKFTHDEIQNELIRVLEKDNPQNLKKYQTLSDDEKKNVTSAIAAKINDLNDIKKYKINNILIVYSINKISDSPCNY